MKTRLSILILFFPIFLNSTELDYGLYIKSYPYKISELSNLVLENGQPIQLNGDIVLSFDVYIRNDNVFGNIVRILTDKNENIDLLITVGLDDKRFPIFVINESVYPIQQEVVREQWIPVSITLSPKNNTLKLLYGEEEITVPYPIAQSKSFRTAFGLCLFDGFMLENVASFNLKDVRITKKGKPFRYWKLEKHRQEICYDSLEYVPAVALNPQWIIDDHITWSNVFTDELPESPSIAYNPKTDEFYIVSNSKEVIVFNAQTLEKKIIPVRSGLYVANAPNQLLYIPDRNALVSYNMDENLYSFFSFNTQTWSNHTPNKQEHSYWNNSVTYDATDRSIISFGGYGFYRYNNELVKKYPYGNKPGSKVQLTDISPRYSSGSALIDNTLYIFGGRGNKSGRQELFPKNYYDFYAVNLQTNQVNKLWEITEMEGGDFVPSENLIYDPDNKCFYMFTSQAAGNLLKITPEKAGIEPMSLPVNADFEDQFLYTNLYYSPRQKKLFAIINKSDVNNNSVINIYSINYPPIAVTALIQPAPEENRNGSRTQLIIAICVIMAGILGGYVAMRNRRRSKQQNTARRSTQPKENNEKESVNTNKIKAEKEETVQVQNYDFSKSSVCFLGGFHVRDKQGDDITSAFTPTLKALLILLILYTEENKRGVSGKKMFQLLWEDKSESSARNNRNVYLSKLRTMLEKIGDIEILSEGGFWSIRFSSGVLCDYCEAMHYLKNVKEEHLDDENEYNKLLELLLRGTLLPNTEIDWIDRFKSDFSNFTIDTLSTLLTSQTDISNNLKFRIAETLFQHDFINEDALHIKCKILSESGKMGLAKSFYDNYCKEYFNLLGTEYKYSLTEVIKGNNLER